MYGRVLAYTCVHWYERPWRPQQQVQWNHNSWQACSCCCWHWQPHKRHPPHLPQLTMCAGGAPGGRHVTQVPSVATTKAPRHLRVLRRCDDNNRNCRLRNLHRKRVDKVTYKAKERKTLATALYVCEWTAVNQNFDNFLHLQLECETQHR